MKNFF